MNKIKLFIKSIGYFIQLIYLSSKFGILLYLVLNIVCGTFPLVGVYILKTVIDQLMASLMNLSTITVYVSFRYPNADTYVLKNCSI